MSKHGVGSYPGGDWQPELTDAEIEAILLAETDLLEDAPPAFEMVQAPGKASPWARWLLGFMFVLVLVGSWVRP